MLLLSKVVSIYLVKRGMTLLKQISFFIGLLLFVGMAVACSTPPAVQPTLDSPETIPTLAPTAATVATAEPEPTEPTATAIPEPTADPELETIVIPIAIYILDDADGELSSGRTVADIEQIYERVNEIWSQANIELEVQTIQRATVPQDLLLRLNNRDFFSFFNAVNSGDIDLPSFAPIVGFYTQQLGGPNGINPSNSNAFFVMDTPSVFDERVTSHEIGHILGLHHVLDDAGRLLYSGTNGMALSDEEIVVARYSAEGLLNRVR